MPRKSRMQSEAPKKRHQLRKSFGFDDNGKFWMELYHEFQARHRSHLPESGAINCITRWLLPRVKSGEIDVRDILMEPRSKGE